MTDKHQVAHEYQRNWISQFLLKMLRTILQNAMRGCIVLLCAALTNGAHDNATLALVLLSDESVELAGSVDAAASIFIASTEPLLQSGESLTAAYSQIPVIRGFLKPETMITLSFDHRVSNVTEDCRFGLNESDSVELSPEVSAALLVDKRAASFWNLDRIDQRSSELDFVYASDNEASGVVIYILDTGIRATHAEFNDRVVSGWAADDNNHAPNGWIDDSNSQCSDHGTHCAGTAAGATAGVARQALIVPVAVLDCEGSGLLSNVVAGIDWMLNDVAERRAVSNPPAGFVASLSLGLHGDAPVLNAALRDAVTVHDIVVVVAAGNAAWPADDFSPARVDAVVTVGGTARGDVRATWSNHGPSVNIWAPAVDVLSATTVTDYSMARRSGTSMATPLVAGVAAQIISSSPGLSAREVSFRMYCTATQNVVTFPSSAVDGTVQSNRLLHAQTSQISDCPEPPSPPVPVPRHPPSTPHDDPQRPPPPPGPPTQSPAPTLPPPVPSSPAPPPRDDAIDTTLIIGIAIAGFAFVCLIGVACYYRRWHLQVKQSKREYHHVATTQFPAAAQAAQLPPAPLLNFVF